MRLPGRFRRDGCGNFKCRLCGPNGDEIKRWRKRIEAREVAVEIEDERAYVSRLWAEDWDSPEDFAYDGN